MKSTKLNFYKFVDAKPPATSTSEEGIESRQIAVATNKNTEAINNIGDVLNGFIKGDSVDLIQVQVPFGQGKKSPVAGVDFVLTFLFVEFEVSSFAMLQQWLFDFVPSLCVRVCFLIYVYIYCNIYCNHCCCSSSCLSLKLLSRHVLSLSPLSEEEDGSLFRSSSLSLRSDFFWKFFFFCWTVLSMVTSRGRFEDFSC